MHHWHLAQSPAHVRNLTNDCKQTDKWDKRHKVTLGKLKYLYKLKYLDKYFYFSRVTTKVDIST